MEPILLLIILAGFPAAVAFLRHRRRSSAAGSPGRRETFIAELLGLAGKGPAGKRWARVRDHLREDLLPRFDDGSLRLERTHSPRGTCIVVGGLRQGPGALRMRRERPEEVEKGFGRLEITTGDAGFDRKVALQGSVPLARAILDAETRQVLGGLLGGVLIRDDGSEIAVRAWITGEDLRIEIPRCMRGGTARDPERLARALEAAVRIAKLLEAPVDIPARIALNFGREPQVRVRLQCLLTLIREFPGDPSTRRALVAAREDGSDEVRLQAAIALGEEGTATLLDLASRAGTADAFAARAILALGERLPTDRCSEILAAAIPAGRTGTAAACIRTIAERGEAAVEALARVLLMKIEVHWMPFAARARIRAVAAQALGRTGAPSAEGPLVEAFGRAGLAVRIAAARALGRVGSVAAVPSLREVEEKSPEEPLKRAVRQAVASIQERLSGAEHGQLTLAAADGEAGSLSLAEEGRAGRSG